MSLQHFPEMSAENLPGSFGKFWENSMALRTSVRCPFASDTPKVFLVPVRVAGFLFPAPAIDPPVFHQRPVPCPPFPRITPIDAQPRKAVSPSITCRGVRKAFQPHNFPVRSRQTGKTPMRRGQRSPKHLIPPTTRTFHDPFTLGANTRSKSDIPGLPKACLQTHRHSGL